ncbi:MAG: lamin tail domain-containing protein [Patescibacteria group bacterium]
MSSNTLLTLGLGVLIAPALVGAASVDVVVSEVNWAGSSSSASDEWLELTNRTMVDIDLAGWSLWTVAGEPKELLRVEYGSLPSQGTYLIANNGPDYQFSGGSSTLTVIPDFVASSLSLSNSALRLELRNAAGEVIDRVGDGSKPFAGNTEPIASMQRLLSNSGSGTAQTDWQSSVDPGQFDGPGSQFGSPTASGRTQVVVPVVTPAPMEDLSSQIPEATLEGLVNRTVSSTVRLRAQVTVSDLSYKSRTVVIADGEWSAELSLPADSSLRLERGDTVEVVGKVSTGGTPKLLLGADRDLIVRSKGSVAALEFSKVSSPKLFQLVHLIGRAHPVRGSVEVVMQNGRTVKMTRRQGVVIPDVADGDTVSLTGLVVAQDPETVRVVEDQALEVTGSTDEETVDEAASTASTVEARELEVTDETESSVEEVPDQERGLEDLEEIVGDHSRLAATQSDPVGRKTASVLGARDFRNSDPGSMASLTLAVITLCAILIILGDSLWLYLKQKQLH